MNGPTGCYGNPSSVEFSQTKDDPEMYEVICQTTSALDSVILTGRTKLSTEGKRLMNIKDILELQKYRFITPRGG